MPTTITAKHRHSMRTRTFIIFTHLPLRIDAEAFERDRDQQRGIEARNIKPVTAIHLAFEMQPNNTERSIASASTCEFGRLSTPPQGASAPAPLLCKNLP